MRGPAATCLCQRFKTPPRQWDAEWAPDSSRKRASRLREQTNCGNRVRERRAASSRTSAASRSNWCAVNFDIDEGEGKPAGGIPAMRVLR